MILETTVFFLKYQRTAVIAFPLKTFGFFCIFFINCKILCSDEHKYLMEIHYSFHLIFYKTDMFTPLPKCNYHEGKQSCDLRYASSGENQMWILKHFEELLVQHQLILQPNRQT